MMHLAAGRNHHEILDFLGKTLKCSPFEKDSEGLRPNDIVGKYATGDRTSEENKQKTAHWFDNDDLATMCYRKTSVFSGISKSNVNKLAEDSTLAETGDMSGNVGGKGFVEVPSLDGSERSGVSVQ